MSGRDARYGDVPRGTNGEVPGRQHDANGIAADLHSSELDLQQRYARPSEFTETIADGSNVPHTPLGAVYAAPSQEKDRFQFKQYLKASGALAAGAGGANGPNQQATWAVTDRDVDMFYQMREQARLHSYHQWLANFIDLRRPGNYKLLASLEPDYVRMKIKAFDAQQEFAKRQAMIRNFGVRNQSDLRFKWLMDKAELQDQRVQNDGYLPGMLSPQRNAAGWSPWTNAFGAINAVPGGANFGWANAMPASSGRTLAAYGGPAPLGFGGNGP